MADKKEFPEVVNSFAKGLCKLCREHKFYDFNGEFTPSSFHNEDCRDWDTFRFHWESGRHEARSRGIVVNAKKSMRMDIKEEA